MSDKGVCTALAAYAQVDVSLVRWIFAIFVIPVVPTRAAFAAAQHAD